MGSGHGEEEQLGGVRCVRERGRGGGGVEKEGVKRKDKAGGFRPQAERTRGVGKGLFRVDINIRLFI